MSSDNCQRCEDKWDKRFTSLECKMDNMVDSISRFREDFFTFKAKHELSSEILSKGFEGLTKVQELHKQKLENMDKEWNKYFWICIGTTGTLVWVARLLKIL